MTFAAPPAAPAPAIVILATASLPVARQIQQAMPQAQIYGLTSRVNAPDVTAYDNFGDALGQLFQANRPIIGLCAAGILIRTLAPRLSNKWQEPPVLAVAEDGSAVVPLLGGLQGVNDWARQLGAILDTAPAITTTGDIRFRTALLAPPPGYRLVNPEDAKTFLATLLAGATVRRLGSAPWLEQSRIPWSDTGALTVRVVSSTPEAETPDSGTPAPSETCLVYAVEPPQPQPGTLAIVGTGPGCADWLSPQVRQVLQSATDWVGYKTYLNLAAPLHRPHIQRHGSDNRVERDRAKLALDLAATGRAVAVISSGDPGIYAMAAAVFEVLEQGQNPAWAEIEIQVCPGISAMQAAAALAGAPLGHDFCAISLSDILKPWPVIEQRLTAAAAADFAIALYNPISSQRPWQLTAARDRLLQHRAPTTPIVLGRNLGRPGQQVTVKDLGRLKPEDADMGTVILIGSSQTRRIQRNQAPPWVYTPRWYPAEPLP